MESTEGEEAGVELLSIEAAAAAKQRFGELEG